MRWSLRTAQLQVVPAGLPALTEREEPRGATLNGGDCVFRPQHTRVWSVRSPQLWSPPALMALKVPGGAVASPSALLPQHTAVSSVRIAHVCRPPASMALNVPGGVADCPLLFEPQQMSVLSGLIAQEWAPPAVTWTGAVGGAPADRPTGPSSRAGGAVVGGLSALAGAAARS